MAQLNLTTTEKISVAGKRVSNSKSHNISGINNVYQETIQLNKRPASYAYLYVAEFQVLVIMMNIFISRLILLGNLMELEEEPGVVQL